MPFSAPPPDPDPILHEEQGHRGAFFIERGGQRVAAMTYSRVNATVVIIDHTEVHAELSGQGVGSRLLDHVADWARETHTKLLATCPFATQQFARDRERYHDVLA